MSNLADGYACVVEAALRGARPDPPLEIDKWSEEHMVVPMESAKPGRYRIAHTPMARRVLQVLSPRHSSRRVVVRGASQMLKTQVALNFLAASAHLAPANMLVLEPTDSLAKRLSARVSKTVRDVKVLQEVFAKPRSRDNRNTVFAKDFTGGTMLIATAGSAANLAEFAARYVYVDEIDRLQLNVDGEGDPVLLAEARATTFEAVCKFLHTSSPKLKGSSKIDALFEMGTQEVYLVPCPHCDHHHELAIENFRYQRDEGSGYLRRAWFVCPSCGAEIEERQKPRMLRDEAMGGTARWEARAAGDGETVSFHVSAFYAPVGSITWLKLAREHAHAKKMLQAGDQSAMQVFYNTRLAQSWELQGGRADATALTRRAATGHRYGVVPWGVLQVVAGVDVQGDRIEARAWGIGRNGERWLICREVFIGDTAIAEPPPDDEEALKRGDNPWSALTVWRRTPLQHVSGAEMRIRAVAVDTGFQTHMAYMYCRRHGSEHVIAIKGETRAAQPILGRPSDVDVNHQGRKIKRGVKKWPVGTDTAKELIYSRLCIEKVGPGFVHLPRDLPGDEIDQLTAETRVVKYVKGRTKYEWVRPSNRRNEALDCAVYAEAAAHYLGAHRYTEVHWKRLEAQLEKARPAAVPDADQVAAPEQDAPAPQPVAQPKMPAQRPRRRSFAKSW